MPPLTFHRTLLHPRDFDLNTLAMKSLRNTKQNSSSQISQSKAERNRLKGLGQVVHLF